MQNRSKTEETIQAQRIRLLYSQSTTAVAVSIGVALLTAYHFWQAEDALYMSVWVAFLIAVSVFRLILFHQFSRASPADSELGAWLRWHVVGSLLGGASWGALGLLYDPGWAAEQQVILLIVIAGLATAAISSYAAALESYIAFLIPLLLPLLGRLFAINSVDSDYLWLIVLIFGAGLLGVARNFHTHVVNTMRLVVEQESLQQAILTGTEQLKKTERALHTTELRFGQVMESSLDGFWDWDIQNETIYFSPRFKQQLGFSDHELPNELASWESRLHPDDKEQVLSRVHAYLKNPWGYWEEEFRLRHKDGSYKWILARAVPTLDGDKQPIRLTGVHIDITERKKSERKIKYLAYHDWLTKLPNRILFNDRLEHALTQAKRTKKKVFVLFVDLDQFKHVNDSLGHPVGDKVLRQVASRLVGQTRKSDTLARLSGDEFALLVENTVESEDIIVLTEKLLACLRLPFVEEGHSFSLGASIGISAFPGDGDDAATLLKNADAAMYRAKSSGRNRFHFYSEDLTNAAFKHIKLEHGLRQALLENQFLVYYQPKLCLQSGRVLGAEALLRWKHPEEGFISPQDFIPVAEESGLIMEIGEWVLRQACEQAVSWERQGLAFEHIAVNVSGVQVQHEAFVDSVKGNLESSGLQPRRLELELTENFLMKDVEASASLLADLRQLGISIAVDDFGTGYSSLAYLTRFPVNKLKIDRSFIANVLSDEQNKKIAHAIINLGHSLNMKVVAEGIEFGQQLDLLKDKGCDEGQGYLIAKPLPNDEFVDFLKHYDARKLNFRQTKQFGIHHQSVTKALA
jgi:diguanylate cyclase (GGDEF)-like protein/PAS domain S-box-containing protein